MPYTLDEVYERLLAFYGPQHWWPAQTAFEVMVGAVLTQNTSWKNVERAIENLREAGLLEPHALHRASIAELEVLLKPAGYFRLKAGRLRNLLRWFVEKHDASIKALRQADPLGIREELLAVNGIGPETADSILLYALAHPVFVVDTYTHRVLKRHGWIEFEADYHAVQEHCASNIETSTAMFNEFHALLVRVGHEHCRKTAICEGCPLAELLPPGGPLEPY